MPPKVPQTTRNVVKINNFIQPASAISEGKPIKLNFKKLNASNRKNQTDQESHENTSSELRTMMMM